MSTAHCTITAVDIEGFGRHTRTNTNQVRVRRGLYRAIQSSFDAASIPWASCRCEDRGDGALVLAPAEVRKTLFTERLPEELVDALAQHNRSHPVEEQIRLRLAVHAGEITYDDHGVTAASITHTFRLLEAPRFKTTVAHSSCVLAIIGSTWFYDEVIRHSEPSQPHAYASTNIRNKETTTRGWIRLLS